MMEVLVDEMKNILHHHFIIGSSVFDGA